MPRRAYPSGLYLMARTCAKRRVRNRKQWVQLRAVRKVTPWEEPSSADKRLKSRHAIGL